MCVYSLGGLDLATTTGTVYSKRVPQFMKNNFAILYTIKVFCVLLKHVVFALVCTGHATNAETNPSHVFDKIFYFNFKF